MHTRDDYSGTMPDYPMTVYLYPYADTSELKSTVKSDGTVTKAIKYALDQLADYNAIDHYAIYRWRYEDSGKDFPYWGDIDNCTSADISENFKHWLGVPEDNLYLSSNCYYDNLHQNDMNENYYKDHSGVHQLIHNGSTGCNETDGYAPDTAGAESHGQTAFQEGRVAWSPVCSDTSLEEAAAIQEAVHLMMHPAWDRTVDCVDDENRPDCSNYTNPRQHSTGTLHYYPDWDYTETTPMLAYHWDDFDTDKEDPNCPCMVDKMTDADSHTREMTSCAKESVYDTSRNLDNLC